MAKILSSLSSSAWSKCLPLLYRRFFGTEIKGMWNEAPQCEGRKMPKAERKCLPKEGNCPSNWGGCPTTDWPKCSEPDIKPSKHLSCCRNHCLTENACEQPTKKITLKREKTPFKSMWETGGIERSSPNINERLDETNYKSSDKIKRIYTQTWNSCEPIIRHRKVCCINDICMLPPLERRPKEACPQTAKEQDSEQLKVDFNILTKCLENVAKNFNTKRTNKCRKIVMPCCRKVAKQVKCHRNRRHSDCLKECCPHPSFSERDHSSLKQLPPDECRCSHFENQCEASRYLIRKKIFQLPPALPAWPPKERPK